MSSPDASRHPAVFLGSELMVVGLFPEVLPQYPALIAVAEMQFFGKSADKIFLIAQHSGNQIPSPISRCFLSVLPKSGATGIPSGEKRLPTGGQRGLCAKQWVN